MLRTNFPSRKSAKRVGAFERLKRTDVGKLTDEQLTRLGVEATEEKISKAVKANAERVAREMAILADMVPELRTQL